MRKSYTVEDLFLEWGVGYEEAAPGTYTVNDGAKGWYNVVISTAGDVVVVRLDVMELPSDPEKKAGLMEEVLKKNGDGLMFGAYAIVDNRLILFDTLLSETMDPEELKSSMDALSMALVEHFPVLSKYKNA